MTASEFLSYLKGLDVKIWCEGERLRLKAPKNVLNAQIKKQLGEFKPELLKLLLGKSEPMTGQEETL